MSGATTRKTPLRYRGGHQTLPGQEINNQTPASAAQAQGPVDDDQFANDALFGERPFIDDIQPRPGMAQKWVRVLLSGQDDVRNISKQMQLGWKPRALDTIVGGYSPPTIRHASLGNVIGVGDLVLFEMPQERADKINAVYERRHAEQLRAVNAQMRDETGGRLEVLEQRSSTSRQPSFANE